MHKRAEKRTFALGGRTRGSKFGQERDTCALSKAFLPSAHSIVRIFRYYYLPRRAFSSGVMIALMEIFFFFAFFITTSFVYLPLPRGEGWGSASPMSIILFAALDDHL